MQMNTYGTYSDIYFRIVYLNQNKIVEENRKIKWKVERRDKISLIKIKQEKRQRKTKTNYLKLIFDLKEIA